MEGKTSRTRLDAWEKEGIAKLHIEGKTQREISTLLSIPLKTVNKHIKTIRERQVKDKASKRDPKALTELKIDLQTPPDEEVIKNSVMIAFRRGLYELQERFPVMTDQEVFNATMRLFAEMNKPEATE